jgi:hypothetical protein
MFFLSFLHRNQNVSFHAAAEFSVLAGHKFHLKQQMVQQNEEAAKLLDQILSKIFLSKLNLFFVF